MKQSIQLRLGQHLTMTPQLQQAIRLLQLSSMELQTEIQETIEANPMLEMNEGTEEDFREYNDSDNPPGAADADAVHDHNAAEISDKDTQPGQDNRDTEIDMQQTEIPDDLPVDTIWDDIYDGGPAHAASSEYSDREVEIHDTNSQTLQEHLLWQIQMAPLTERDKMIAEGIIDSVNDDGYLISSLEDIHDSLDNNDEILMEEVESVLCFVQHLDPPGVGAKEPGECLLIQLKQLDPEIPHIDTAVRLVSEHMDLLASHDYKQLLRRMKLDENTLQKTIDLIRSLNPRPGSSISNPRIEYIAPDVYVKKIKGKWVVELNPGSSPRLRINSFYASLIKRADNSEDNVYLKSHLQEAKWFIKSLQSRNETLLKVSKSIVKRQQAFLEHGEVAMKALILHDIAEEVDMHESTVSRVTTRKYMHTPRGIFELKYFFSSHVSTASGGECSSTAIRALIKKFIEAENPRKPLSDNKIALLLAGQGINVARRTVAKYREAMKLPPSNERKRLV
jgi:RNA polymerase sigma-54 factor